MWSSWCCCRLLWCFLVAPLYRLVLFYSSKHVGRAWPLSSMLCKKTKPKKKQPQNKTKKIQKQHPVVYFCTVFDCSPNIDRVNIWNWPFTVALPGNVLQLRNGRQQWDSIFVWLTVIRRWSTMLPYDIPILSVRYALLIWIPRVRPSNQSKRHAGLLEDSSLCILHAILVHDKAFACACFQCSLNLSLHSRKPF